MAAHRLQPGQKLVIASHNRGKIPEFQRLLQPLGLELSCAADYGIPEPEETGTTFTENALIKARAVAAACGLPALADDSGLAVTALNGDPGVYSARWAGPERDFNLAMQKIETLLADKSDRSAQFVTVLALCWPDGTTQTYDGAVGGTLIWPPRGPNGFGYDPVFMPEGYTQTFGEISAEQKNKLSHRARACAAMIAEMQTPATRAES